MWDECFDNLACVLTSPNLIYSLICYIHNGPVTLSIYVAESSDLAQILSLSPSHSDVTSRNLSSSVLVILSISIGSWWRLPSDRFLWCPFELHVRRHLHFSKESSLLSFLYLTRRFWNHIFTCFSERFR